MFNKVPDLCKNILITGGAGFIGSCLIRTLLRCSDSIIYNIDKLGYASDLVSIESEIKSLNYSNINRHKLINIDISNKDLLAKTIKEIDPDFVFHLAAESHVDRSIEGPEIFVRSNIMGTFNLLAILHDHYQKLVLERKKNFRFHHVSTDEVFGSIRLGAKFSEKSPYNPQSPYSATKAASDHLVRAWQATYGFPITISNCSNNYGPWQQPDKLIPLIIYRAIRNQTIPIYGSGENIRDWIFVEDHVNAILNIAFRATTGSTYCVGGCNEYSNLEVANYICDYLDVHMPKDKGYGKQITFVNDRPGHDFRYAIDNSLISRDLQWEPNFSFKNALNYTINWYLNNLDWCDMFFEKNNKV